MFDPFAYLDVVAEPGIDEEMITMPLGDKVVGIDEGIFMGILIGFLLADFLEEL